MDTNYAERAAVTRISTGVEGLDQILGGGLVGNRIYLVQGEPGTGKTTLALQFLLAGVRRGERCLFVNFSETSEEMQATAASHGWSLEGIQLLELSAIESRINPETQNTLFNPSEVELNQTTKILMDEVARVQPTLVVFDSASEMRLMAETSLRYRRQLLALKQYFAGRKITVLFLDIPSDSSGEFQIQSIVHGVIELNRRKPEYGIEKRQLRVSKFRGISYMEGGHDYVIRRGGVDVYPREPAETVMTPFIQKSVPSGVPNLDELLGGGIDYGTTSLFMGPAGSGKSTITLQYAHSMAVQGEKVALFAFEEDTRTILGRAKSMSLDLIPYAQNGTLLLRKIDPAELTPGEFAARVRELVLREDVKMVIIDSLSGYIHAMPEEKYLILHMHELLSFLNRRGVATLLVLAQQGMVGAMQTPIDLTYLADTVVITRFFEAHGSLKKAVAVLKKRTGPHETTIRELRIDPAGVSVGEPLIQFQGIMTGVPVFTGHADEILKEKQRKAG